MEITAAQAITGETPAELLEKHFGFTEFRPGQEVVIDALHDHGAALAVFPTGGGKSLCYQLSRTALPRPDPRCLAADCFDEGPDRFSGQAQDQCRPP